MVSLSKCKKSWYKIDMFIYNIWKSMLTCVITLKKNIWPCSLKYQSGFMKQWEWKMGWNDIWRSINIFLHAPSDIISSHYPFLLFHKSWLVFEWIGSNIKFRFNRRGWLLCFQLWVDNGLKLSMEKHMITFLILTVC